jgi:serine/threonine protein kinase
MPPKNVYSPGGTKLSAQRARDTSVSLQEQFRRNPSINPHTGRRITTCCKTYKDLVTEFGEPYNKIEKETHTRTELRNMAVKDVRILYQKRFPGKKVPNKPQMIVELVPAKTGGTKLTKGAGEKKITKKSTKKSPKKQPSKSSKKTSPGRKTPPNRGTNGPNYPKQIILKRTPPKDVLPTMNLHRNPGRKQDIIGSGSFGAVEKRVLNNGMTVAIKHTKPSLNGIDYRALREIHCLQLMKDSEHFLHIIAIDMNVDADGDTVTNVDMALTLHKSDMSTFIEEVSVGDRIRLFPKIKEQLLNGLYHMYLRGLIHRDIKPANILMNYDLNHLDDVACYYADFGLSRQLACNTNERAVLMTKSVGTLDFVAPEIILGSDHYTENIDMWALALTFAEYITENIIAGSGIFNMLGSSKYGFSPYYSTLGQRRQSDTDSYNSFDRDIRISYNYTLEQNKESDDYLDVQAFLQNHLHPINLSSIDPADIRLMERMLMFSPDKRLNIYDIKSGKMKPPSATMPSRGNLRELSIQQYYELVDLIFTAANTLPIAIKTRTLIGAIDLLERFLAHYPVDDRHTKLLPLCCLMLAVKMVENIHHIKIQDYMKVIPDTFTSERITYEETIKLFEVFLARKMNYLFISCDIDVLVHALELHPNVSVNQLYETMKQENVYPGELPYAQIAKYVA